MVIVRTLDQARKVRVYTFTAGQRIDGLTVVGISEERVKLPDARGGTVVLRRRQPERLAVRIGP